MNRSSTLYQVKFMNMLLKNYSVVCKNYFESALRLTPCRLNFNFVSTFNLTPWAEVMQFGLPFQFCDIHFSYCCFLVVSVQNETLGFRCMNDVHLFVSCLRSVNTMNWDNELLFSVPQFREVCMSVEVCFLDVSSPSYFMLNWSDLCTHNFGPGSVHGHQGNDATRLGAAFDSFVGDNGRAPGVWSEDTVILSNFATVVRNLRQNVFYNKRKAKPKVKLLQPLKPSCQW